MTLSANCRHCHGAHEIRSTKDPASQVSRKNIIKTCGQGHVGIERDYLEGVHGKDYVKGITDVPVCTDCHGEHDILSPQDLSSKVYATKIAALCARCHDIFIIVHGYEALLAFLAVIIWHMYSVHLNPEVFPMSKIWLNGKITGKELRLLHPLECQKVLEERQKQKSEQTL